MIDPISLRVGAGIAAGFFLAGHIPGRVEVEALGPGRDEVLRKAGQPETITNSYNPQRLD